MGLVIWIVALSLLSQAKDSWEMNNLEKLSTAEVSKDKGNIAFKKGELDRAVRWYDKVWTSWVEILTDLIPLRSHTFPIKQYFCTSAGFCLLLVTFSPPSCHLLAIFLTPSFHLHQAVGVVGFDKSFPDELKAQAREVRKSCHLNLAAVHLKKSKYRDVIQNCEKVRKGD